MAKVGLMCGREFSFPPAFIARVNELGKKGGVTAEFVKLGGTKMGEPAEYRVIVDRIDPVEKKIQFALLEEEERSTLRPRKKK